jgi:oligopeptide/dipeptide ABC transporter ATP-binding protein
MTSTSTSTPPTPPPNGETPVVEATGVSVSFPIRQGMFKPKLRLRAVQDVSITIQPRQAYGLVGESGSGKSTTGRALLRLLKIDSGTIRIGGRDITTLGSGQLRPLRRDMQMVFQDPYSSLDPSSVIADIIGEPLRVHEGIKGRQRDDRVRELLRQVGLSPTYTERYPYEFSGGQRQRIAIARAIALNPKLIVLDEAVSALDVSTQNQILELLEKLRDELGVAYLFISHNLSVIRWLADRTAVMYLGRIVEEGPTERVYTNAAHPYTESLLSAVPVPDPVVQRGRRRIILSGDIPDPLHPPSGCTFRTRCLYAMDICAQVEPEHTELPDGGGWVACHLHTTEPGTRIDPTTKARLEPPVTTA